MHPPHFFKYYTANTAKIVLATQRVRWNSPLNFNDPFDCYFSLPAMFDMKSIAGKRRGRLLDLLTNNQEPELDHQNPFARYIATLRHLAKGRSREELEETLGTLLEESGIEYYDWMSCCRKLWEKVTADLRLFCVCEMNDNLLLWAHYASNHTGAVFQFECIAKLDVPLLAAQAVKYSDVTPILEMQEEWIDSVLGLRPLITGEEATHRFIMTKARAFEHEKEWRVVSKRRSYENQGYEDVKFFSREISKVFLGCRISDSDRTDVLSLLTGPFAHAEAFQARQHPERYELEFERIK